MRSRELGGAPRWRYHASAELQERDALKSVGLAVAMADALKARGVPDPTALVAAELGVLAFKRGYAEWTALDRDVGTDLATYTSRVLDELRTASAALG